MLYPGKLPEYEVKLLKKLSSACSDLCCVTQMRDSGVQKMLLRKLANGICENGALYNFLRTARGSAFKRAQTFLEERRERRVGT